MYADERLAAARLWAANRQPYLATALFAMTPVAAPGLGTFGVDRSWRLYVDPAILDTWTTEQAGSVLVHETHHLLRDHAGRAKGLGIGDREAARWNVAADLEINDDLADLPLPPNGCTPQGFGLTDGELAETYYHQLTEGSEPTWGDCGPGAHGTGTFAIDREAPSLDQGEADLLRQQVAREVQRLKRAGQEIGPGLERWANNVLNPKVDWRRLLASEVRTGIASISGRVDYSYGRPNRRWSGAGARVVMPALVQPVPDVAVVVDTSGSMGRTELELALAEISGVLAATGATGSAVRVLSCDAELQSTQRVFATNAVRLHGGGGTDMRVGLDAAAALRPKPQVVVVLTDGYTPWPDERPPFARTIIVQLGEIGEVAPAWARVIEVPLS